MANQERGEVGVTVGGKAYTLRPTFDSMAEFEALMSSLGHPGMDMEAACRQGVFSGMRAVVWCLLQDDHAAEIKTLKDASRWIERAGGLSVISPWIDSVMGLNKPPEGAPQPGTTDPPEAQAGTGEALLPELVGSV